MADSCQQRKKAEWKDPNAESFQNDFTKIQEIIHMKAVNPKW